jgi:hypothetical protein
MKNPKSKTIQNVFPETFITFLMIILLSLKIECP